MKRGIKAVTPEAWTVPGFVLARTEAAHRDDAVRFEQATIGIMMGGASGQFAIDGGDTLDLVYRNGDIWFAPRHSSVTVKSANYPPNLVLLIDHRKECDIVEELSKGSPGRLNYRANVVSRDIHNLRRLLVQFIERSNGRGDIYLESLLVMLTYEVFMEAWKPEASGSRRIHSLPPSVMRRVLDHIEQHLQSSITLASLAMVAGLSRYHFTRCFHNETGQPPYQYVMTRRLELARHLLEADEIPISEVAVKTGFTSQANLTTAFRRAYGVTPLAFRRSR